MNALVISKSLFFFVTLFFWTAQSLLFGLLSPFALDCTVQSKGTKQEVLELSYSQIFSKLYLKNSISPILGESIFRESKCSKGKQYS